MIRSLVFLLTFISIFLAPLGLAAQQESALVDFVMGQVEGEDSGTWKPLKPGVGLVSSSRIRLGPGARIDLVLAKTWVVLDGPGTFTIGDILAKADKGATYGLDAIIGRKLKAFNPSTLDSKTAAGGVRAASADSTTTFQDAGLMLRAGIEKLSEGDTAIALGLIEEAFTNQFDDDAIYFYYYGLSLHLSGRSTEAADVLASAPPGASTFLTEEILGSVPVLTSRLLILSCVIQASYQNSAKLASACNTALAFSGHDISSRQEILLLKALAAAWGNDELGRKTALEEIIRLNPESSEAVQARELLGQ